MLNLTLALVVSFVTTLLIVRYAHVHAHFSSDSDTQGVQKVHAHPVPRIGGLGIMLGLLAAGTFATFNYSGNLKEILLLTLSAAPVFLGGFVEDVTKRVSPRTRLLCAMVSALVAYWILGIHINRVDIVLIDKMLAVPFISIVLTVVCVAAMTNAINIIDGFNGLAAMVSIFMFMSLGYVAFQVGDNVVLTATMIMIGAVLGFFILNYPNGLIFLGDGGAYFVGFMLAELAILLVMRNPAVSPWYPALMLIYPIFEVCFSIYRRRFVRGVSPSMPDGVHLHMLIYKRVLRWAVGSKIAAQLARRNSMTSPYLWVLCLLAVIPATIFWRYSGVLAACCFVFVVMYIWLYQRIVRFRSPRWMILKKK
ncbi:MraY family glycosyltransferase [Pandoraea pulmonicola]|uniref:Glycosyl transferase n=1 Tax=Pandoraea pulmonicola TaxID=93221 RepID=A0AAJ4ZEC6_PANPU|nr:glycosyltransferase [Pandoraea pulmonicola]AJC19961.1 glycosyl transferase [Pandoraea pulmonicola]SUA91797.1 Undecaprenyl-phosphate alpha-N-acetylglucosaminyl 1-phosphate transferase [Pandoraea pulmonicola]